MVLGGRPPGRVGRRRISQLKRPASAGRFAFWARVFGSAAEFTGRDVRGRSTRIARWLPGHRQVLRVEPAGRHRRPAGDPVHGRRRVDGVRVQARAGGPIRGDRRGPATEPTAHQAVPGQLTAIAQDRRGRGRAAPKVHGPAGPVPARRADRVRRPDPTRRIRRVQAMIGRGPRVPVRAARRRRGPAPVRIVGANRVMSGGVRPVAPATVDRDQRAHGTAAARRPAASGVRRPRDPAVTGVVPPGTTGTPRSPARARGARSPARARAASTTTGRTAHPTPGRRR
jgi:hypothetical protein